MAKKFPVFATVALGMPHMRGSRELFREILRQNLMDAGIKEFEQSHRENVFDDPPFTVASTETEVDLVAPSLAELGINNPPSLALLYERAVGQGLGLCAWEAGVRFRLTRPLQAGDERLIVALQLSPLTNNFPLFDVGQDDSHPYLRGYYAFPGNLRGLGERFVFSQDRNGQGCFAL